MIDLGPWIRWKFATYVLDSPRARRFRPDYDNAAANCCHLFGFFIRVRRSRTTPALRWFWRKPKGDLFRAVPKSDPKRARVAGIASFRRSCTKYITFIQEFLKNLGGM